MPGDEIGAAYPRRDEPNPCVPATAAPTRRAASFSSRSFGPGAATTTCCIPSARIFSMSVRAQQASLTQQPVTAGVDQVVRQQFANCLGQRHRAEFHAMAPLRTDTISAMMLSAISSGVRDPISRPMGVRMRSVCSFVRPALCRRLQTLFVRARAAEHTDVRRRAGQGSHQGRVVNLGVVGQHSQVAVAVQPQLLQRLVRIAVQDLFDVREAFASWRRPCAGRSARRGIPARERRPARAWPRVRPRQG